MGSSKEKKSHKKRRLGPSKKVNNTKRKKEKKVKKTPSNNGKSIEYVKSKSSKVKEDIVRFPTAAQQLMYFHQQYESTNRVQLSSIELDSFTVLFVMSRGSIGNYFSTSSEIVIWTAYTLSSLDPPLLWEYIGYLVVVVGFFVMVVISDRYGYSTSMLVSCLSSELKGLIFGAKMPNGTMNAGKNQMG
ncbi:putative organic cation/carnitine transporter 3-like [Capsicum annuum]|nr:putative organic cation/carnitine transporter 3-like [Capsicum annuum]